MQLAPSAQKRELLNAFIQITGYHRKYGMWLLNHSEEGQTATPRARPRHYGPEVQEALVLVWNAANRICAKNLIPFLPTFVETLEQHGHLRLSDACREQLLAMSAATADRLLRTSRAQGCHGLSATRAGTLLKQQIPIRTFHQWNQTQPGFLEVDVVAHCETNVEGDYVSTLTLTDVATGWTECLPLLYKSQETVLAALQHARQLFPFPILGLDTDNGGEFINEVLLSYCEQEQLTFTRGRPYLKNDQCYVEQKNGAIVRQVVGYDRFVGVQACQQLGELYRGLRLYINCFQPCMKLQGKQYDGRKVRLVYDRAKTPLQRLLLSQGLSASREHEWKQMVQALDPVRLFEQVKELQQALFVHSTSASPRREETARVPLRRFCVEGCTTGAPAADVLSPEMVYQPHEKADELPAAHSLLEWHRTRNDPFKEVWELIASWVLAHPERTSGAILRELQRLFPERYQPSHLRTLQRGLRKIRARLRETVVVQWQEEVIPGEVPELTSPGKSEQEADKTAAPVVAIALPTAADPCQEQVREQILPSQLTTEEETTPPQRTATSTVAQNAPVPRLEHPGGCQPSHLSESRTGSGQKRWAMTIERAIQGYLEEQRRGKRRPKTLEWHQTALGLFQQYLLSECQCIFINQIRETEVRGWLTVLREIPTVRGTLRSAGTVESYARSARAFCQWLVRRKYLKQTPFAHLILPNVSLPFLHLLEPEEWERLLLACRPLGGKTVLAEQAAVRNQALLWVLAETGIRSSEVCRLRLCDVDREQGLLRVKGKGSKSRWMPLRQEGLRHLLVYLDRYRWETGQDMKRKRVGEDSLFLSETGRPLTDNGIELLFGRLRKRAGITRKRVSPALLRDTFAVRYLQAGGDLFALRELLGQQESATVKRFLRINEEVSGNEKRKEGSENHRQ